MPPPYFSISYTQMSVAHAGPFSFSRPKFPSPLHCLLTFAKSGNSLILPFFWAFVQGHGVLCKCQAGGVWELLWVAMLGMSSHMRSPYIWSYLWLEAVAF